MGSRLSCSERWTSSHRLSRLAPRGSVVGQLDGQVEHSLGAVLDLIGPWTVCTAPWVKGPLRGAPEFNGGMWLRRRLQIRRLLLGHDSYWRPPVVLSSTGSRPGS